MPIARSTLIQSYRIPVIWLGVLLISAAGGGAGLLAWWLRPAEPAPLQAVEIALAARDAESVRAAAQTYAQAHADRPERILDLLLRAHREPAADLRAACREAIAAVADPGLALASEVLLHAAPPSARLLGGDDAQQPGGAMPPAPPELLALAAIDPPQRWANRLLGDIHRANARLRAAEHAYRRAGSDPEATVARHRAVELALLREDWAQLRSDLDDARWAEAVPPRTRLSLAIEERAWTDALRALPAAMYQHSSRMAVGIACVGGLAWAAILWHLAHGLPERRRLLTLVPLLLFAGVVSTWLTIFILLIQEDIYGFTRGRTGFDQALYCILGIGLREEFTKALCFLPFAPWLARHTPPAAWLLTASLVGLGFAAEENINYLDATGGGGIGPRFLTANFFHICLTGLVGMAICDACADARHWGHAASMFAIAVVVHGLYDAFLIVDQIADYHLASLIILIGAAWYYFNVLHQIRPRGRPDLSVTAIFAWALTGTLAVAFAVIAAEIGPSAAGRTLIPSLLGTVVITVAFVRGIGDRLAN